jgi:hypothetical protein
LARRLDAQLLKQLSSGSELLSATRPETRRDTIGYGQHFWRPACNKRAILTGGPVDPVVSTRTKHDWIVAALGQLGLATTQQYGLYENNRATHHGGSSCTENELLGGGSLGAAGSIDVDLPWGMGAVDLDPDVVKGVGLQGGHLLAIDVEGRGGLGGEPDRPTGDEPTALGRP